MLSALICCYYALTLTIFICDCVAARRLTLMHTLGRRIMWLQKFGTTSHTTIRGSTIHISIFTHTPYICLFTESTHYVMFTVCMFVRHQRCSFNILQKCFSRYHMQCVSLISALKGNSDIWDFTVNDQTNNEECTIKSPCLFRLSLPGLINKACECFS